MHRWSLLAPFLGSIVALAVACDGGDACVPETDLSFCSRQGFTCGEATGFDNCEASRTVACGMCNAGEACVTNMCVGGLDAGGRDGGGVDGGPDGGPTDGGADDAGAPDAGSCLAANGWPVSTLPAGYAGTGFRVGDQFAAVEGLTDQRGATDVSLGQFYGAMVIVAVHVPTSPPSVTMDATAAARLVTLASGSPDYTTVQVSFLVDDSTPGASAAGGYATGADAAAWAALAGGDFPVVAGLPAYQLSVDAAIAALPTIFILDPTYQIRGVIEGYPGDAAIVQAVRDAFAAFQGENPRWTSTYCAE